MSFNKPQPASFASLSMLIALFLIGVLAGAWKELGPRVLEWLP